MPTLQTWSNVCVIFIISTLCNEYVYDISALAVWVFIALVPSVIPRPVCKLKDIPECISFNHYSNVAHVILVPIMKIVSIMMLVIICYHFGELDSKLWFEDTCKYLDPMTTNLCLVLPDSLKACISYTYGAIDRDSFMYALNNIGFAITTIVAMWFCNYMDFEGSIAERIRFSNKVEEILNVKIDEEN